MSGGSQTASGAHARSLRERLAHAVGWRHARVRARLRERFPPYHRIVGELHALTGKGRAALAADMLHAWRSHGLEPLEYVALLLWEVPAQRRADYLVAKTLDPFLETLLDPTDVLLGRDKAAFAEHDRAHSVPWLPTLAVVNRRQGVEIPNVQTIDRPADLWPALERLARNDAVVLKPAFGLQGRGFFVVAHDGSARDADGRAVDRIELTDHVFHYALRGTRYGYLVQPLLRPHAAMVALTGVDALSTLRLVTARHPAGERLLQAFIKIPAPGRLTDNFRRGATGTFIAGVDAHTGVLGELVGRARPDLRHAIARTEVHPITRKQIAGQTLPLWSECVAVARKAAAAHPASPIFGWDVALGPAGWVVLDGNAKWGPVGGQVTAHAGLRPMLAELYPDYWR